MLMIGTSVLGERMYEEWRKQMDLVSPELDQSAHDGRYKRRSSWQQLNTNEQAIWKNVAREISGVLADAMGAIPTYNATSTRPSLW